MRAKLRQEILGWEVNLKEIKSSYKKVRNDLLLHYFTILKEGKRRSSVKPKDFALQGFEPLRSHFYFKSSYLYLKKFIGIMLLYRSL